MKSLHFAEPFQRLNTEAVVMMTPIINARSSGFDLYHKLPIGMYFSMP